MKFKAVDEIHLGLFLYIKGGFIMKRLKMTDTKLWEAIQREEERQEYGLELIASENFVSKAVMEAAGSVMTNKYAEGYPKKRYYGGCRFVDVAEELAIERARELFGAEYVNVQPHSGSQANMAVYRGLINPGDTILGMKLDHGGHLTHGKNVNFSGQDYMVYSYGVERDTEVIDYQKLEEMAVETKPRVIVAGASAYSRTIDFKRFREIADMVGAYLMVDMAHIAGLVAAGVHPSPMPHAHVVTTTTHKTLRGPRGGMILTNDETIIKKINKVIFPGIQGGPLMHIIAAKATAFNEALGWEFKEYQKQVVRNACTLSKELKDRGLRIVSGGTDNHMILVDLTNKDLTGKEAEKLLEEADITVNKNGIPYDTRSPFVTSGIRIGTPALTSRGMKEEEMAEVAVLILRALNSCSSPEILKAIREDVKDLCKKFPLYRED